MVKYLYSWNVIAKYDRLILNKGMPDTKSTCTYVVWNASNFAPSFQTKKHNFCNLPLLLPATLGVLMYEATSIFFCSYFFPQYDSMIISFCARIEYSASMTQKRGLNWTLKLSQRLIRKNTWGFNFSKNYYKIYEIWEASVTKCLLSCLHDQFNITVKYKSNTAA